MNISEMNLGIRDINAISRTGCTTVEELRQKISDDLDGMKRQLGYATFDRIEDALAEIADTPDQPPTVIVSGDYARAVTLTRNIIANAQAAQQSLYEVCTGLKEMRDGKLYKELGYQNFEDYTENEVGIKRAQAYNFISIASNLSADFVQSIGQIGSTKLAMLAMLDEPTREAITETVDVESVTVKELKAQITELTNDKNKLESETADLAQQLDAAQEAITSKSKQFQEAMESKNRDITRFCKEKTDANEKLRKKHAEWVRAQNENATLTGKIYDLEKQIKELESRPVEVAVSEDESKEIERLKAELDDANLRLQQADKTAASKAEHAAALVRDEYEEKLANAQKTEPDEAALDAACFQSFRLVFEKLVDEMEDFLETLHDGPRIEYINKLDDYWTENLLYLRKKGEGAGA